ncbi:hypothetical protein BISA_1375 [Bifidobacterium saguini DSM 23967]|uniref:Helix-turn-helix domain-containing protein n=1 Tax=Bifidobacterium saguini DSM 23967 TaxID=1437607 RepID=A0A087DCF9_9BIFI|nr:hypothetical protein [Bifidobacterium saguini]KFI93209.1 hypothetical protein BISA_1375 [Bifidobacterium saguini DSM 23967]
MEDIQLISRSDAAKMMGKTPGYLATMAYRKKGPRFIRMSRRCVMYDPNDVRQWIESHKVETEE